MALAPDELDALQRAAYGRSAPDERAAAEARLAQLQDEIPPQPPIPVLGSPPPWRALAVLAGVLCAAALATASLAVWSADSRRVFDRAPIAQDEIAWAADFAPGATVRWLGEFVGRDVYGTISPGGSVCVAVPLADGQIAAACEDALGFTIHGVGLVSRTIEGDFGLIWGPTGGVRWGEFPD